MGDGLLRLDFDGGWSIKELSDFLGAFRRAYGSVLHFEHSTESREEFRPRHLRGDFPPFLVVDPMLSRSEQKEDPDAWTTSIALIGEPQLKAIRIASPGLIEALGKLNPLAVISDFIKWLANRDLERAKLENEVERGSLENELLKTKVVKDRVDLLIEMGVPKRKVRELVANQLAEPLLALAPVVEGKNVTAQVKALPEGKAKVRTRKEPPEPGEHAEVEDHFTEAESPPNVVPDPSVPKKPGRL